MSPKKSPKKKAPKKLKTRLKKRLVKKSKKTVKRSPKKPKKTTKKAVKKTIKKDVLGYVTHYFPHVKAAVIKVKKPISLNQMIKIKGHTTDFTQTITSMQIDRVPIQNAKPGDEIGLLVNSRVRRRDIVTKP